MDVSPEAEAIRDDVRHAGLYVNNNEKCDEFEVIDDGSQQGGLRNFEDKSFERSGRSSMLSSIRTDLVTDSVESEVPLEISVDATNISGKQQDDYDIVQINEPKNVGGTALNINALAGGNRAASPAPESNININKYLFSDNDEEEDEELETTGTFNIDMYFATEESVVDEQEVNVDQTKEDLEIDSINERKHEETTVELISNDDHINNDREITVDDEEQALDTSSPFLEVKSETDNVSNTQASDEVDVSVVEGNLEKETASDGADAMNDAFVSLNDGQNDSSILQDEISADAEGTKEELEIKTDTLDIKADVDLRKSVEDLYDQILSGESSPGASTEGLPPDATFGAPIGISTTVDDNKPISPIDPEGKKKGGWLVRVESFSTPSSCTPQIKVIGESGVEKESSTINQADVDPSRDVEEPQKDTDSPQPVPKERKKKKKKKNKKQKSVDLVENSGDEQEEQVTAHTDSATESPAVSPSKKLDHSDIPKQFLDASNTLAGDSQSDTSDVEQEVAEDGTTINKKRSGSKKKNKESCKTQ